MSDKTVYYTTCPVGNASYIAIQKGFLAEGLHEIGADPVKLQTLPLEHWSEHFTHKNEALFRDGGNTPALWTYSEGTPTRLIGLKQEKQRQALLTRKGEKPSSLKELAGKRFAIPIHPNAVIDYHRASAEQAFDNVLKLAGLEPSQVTFVEVYSDANYLSGAKERADKTAEVIAELTALDEGRADVIFVKLSTLQILLDTGKYEEVYDLMSDPSKVAPINNEYPSTITVSEKLAAERPDIVVRYLKQILLASGWAIQNKDEAEEILAEQTFGDVRQYRSSFDANFYAELEPDLSEESLKMLERREQFLYERGYLKQHVDVRKWADPSFLEVAKRELAAGV